MILPKNEWSQDLLLHPSNPGGANLSMKVPPHLEQAIIMSPFIFSFVNKIKVAHLLEQNRSQK